MRAIALAAALSLLGMAAAHAQPADVPALAKLIDNQPADMDRSTWKEKRREAARRLAQSKDRRAVPTLIKLADSETFDIIGEIAIEGLGTLGDPAAASVLQKIANDPAREKVQRDLAKKALGKLGAPAPAPTAAPTPPPTAATRPPPAATRPPPAAATTTAPGTPATSATAAPEPDAPSGSDLLDTSAATRSTGSALLGDRPASDGLPVVPSLPDDTLAASNRLTFTAGTANAAYDSVRKRPSFDVDLGGTYARRVERSRMAWGVDAGAHVVAGMINPEGRAVTRGAQLNLTGGGEARFYAGALYGVGKAAVGTQISYVADVSGDDPMNDLRDTRLAADFQLALGGGYGRVLDVGGAIRVRRLSRTLDAARALGKPIDAATARRLQLTWWALRGERSSFRALVATVAILREAGVLLGEPDAGLTYEILAVLRDSQLFLRPSGLDVQLAFGEGYLRRPGSAMTGATIAGQTGRVEQLLVQAGYGTQLADDTLELSGTGYARLRLFAPDAPAQPSPWAAGATARMRRFTYGEHGDPLGALDVAADVRFSDDDEMDGEVAARVSGQVGFTYWLNQASGVRLAATAAVDGDELFLGAQLSATYGFLDATFAGL